jgi:hypothetical protein
MSSSFQRTEQIKKAAAKKGDILLIRAKKLATKLSVGGESILKLLEQACTEYHTAEDYNKVNKAVCMHARVLGDRAVARLTKALDIRDYERCVHLLTEAKGHYSILSRESGKHSSNSRERDITAEKELNEDAQRVSSTRNPHQRVVSMVRKAIAQEIHQAHLALRTLDYTKALELVQHAMRSDSWLVKEPEDIAAAVAAAAEEAEVEEFSETEIGNEPWTQTPGMQHEELLELRRLIFDTQQMKISVELEELLQQSDLERKFDLKKVLSLLETGQDRYASVIDGPLRNRKLRLIRSMIVEAKIALSAKNNATIVKAHEGKESPTQSLRRLAQNTSKKGDEKLLDNGMEMLSFINVGLFGIQQNIDDNPYGLNEVAVLTADLSDSRAALGMAMVTLIQWAFAPSEVTIEEASLAAKALEELGSYLPSDSDDEEAAFDSKMKLLLQTDVEKATNKRRARRKSSYERMLSSKIDGEDDDMASNLSASGAGGSGSSPKVASRGGLKRQMSSADFASMQKTDQSLKQMRRLSIQAHQEHSEEFEKQKAARRLSNAVADDSIAGSEEAAGVGHEYARTLRVETQHARDSLKKAMMTMQVESKRVEYAYGRLYDRDIETRNSLRAGQLTVTRRMVDAMKAALADVDGGVGAILGAEDGVLEHVIQAEKTLDIAQAAVDTSEDWTSEEDLMVKLKGAEQHADLAKKRALEASQVIFKKQANLQREVRSKREEQQRGEIRDGLLQEAEEKMASLTQQTEKGPYGLLHTPVVSKSFGKTKQAILNARKALEHSVELSSDEAADRGLESLKRRTVTVHHKVQQAEQDMQQEWRRLEQERAKREIRGERERRRLLSGPLTTAAKEVKRAQKLTVTILSSFVMRPAALEEVEAAETLRAEKEAKAAAEARKRAMRRKRMARGGNDDDEESQEEAEREAAAQREAEELAAKEAEALKLHPPHWKYIPEEVKIFNEQVEQMTQQLVAVHEIASEPVDTKYASTMETCLQLLTLQVNDILAKVARTLERAGTLSKQIVAERKERAQRDTQTRAELRHKMGVLKKRLLCQVGSVARHRDNLCSLQCVKDSIRACEAKLKQIAGLLWVPSEVSTELAVEARLNRLGTLANEAEGLVVEAEKIVMEEGKRLLIEMDRRRAHESMTREKLREQLETAMQIKENVMLLPGVARGPLLTEKLVKQSFQEYNDLMPVIKAKLDKPVNTRKSNKHMLAELDELKERTNEATSLASHFKIAAGRANKRWLAEQEEDGLPDVAVEDGGKEESVGSTEENAPTLTSSLEITHTLVKEKARHRRQSQSKMKSQTMSFEKMKKKGVVSGRKKKAVSEAADGDDGKIDGKIDQSASDQLLQEKTKLENMQAPTHHRYSVEALGAKILARRGLVVSGQALLLELIAEHASAFDEAKGLKVTHGDGTVTALIIEDQYISSLLFEASKADDYDVADANMSLLQELARRVTFNEKLLRVDFPEPLVEEDQVAALESQNPYEDGEEAPGTEEELAIDSFADQVAEQVEGIEQGIEEASGAIADLPSTKEAELEARQDAKDAKKAQATEKNKRIVDLSAGEVDSFADNMANMVQGSRNESSMHATCGSAASLHARMEAGAMQRATFSAGMQGRHEADDASNSLAMNTSNKTIEESEMQRMKALWSVDEQEKCNAFGGDAIDTSYVVRIQALQRRRKGQQALSKIHEEREVAMKKLQSLSRGYREKRQVSKLREKVTNATVRIQSLLRQRQGRKRINFLSAIKDGHKHKAATTIQHLVRGHMIGISTGSDGSGCMADIALSALRIARQKLREEQDVNQKQLDEVQRVKEAGLRRRELGSRLCHLTPRFLCEEILRRIKEDREKQSLLIVSQSAAMLMGKSVKKKHTGRRGSIEDFVEEAGEELEEELEEGGQDIFPQQTQMRHTFDAAVNRKGSVELLNLGGNVRRPGQKKAGQQKAALEDPAATPPDDEPLPPNRPAPMALSQAKQDLSRRMRRTSFLTTRTVQAKSHVSTASIASKPNLPTVNEANAATPKDEEWVFRKTARTIVAVIRLKFEGINSLLSDKRNLSRLEHMFRRKSSARLFKPPQESELQTYLLGLLYSPVLEAVEQFGGDVFDYTTDCMTFVWKASSYVDEKEGFERERKLQKVGQMLDETSRAVPDEDENDPATIKGLTAATSVAARCMAQIRECVKNFRQKIVLQSGSSSKNFFHVRMVLGAGPVNMVQLGGTLSRWECMLNGPATDQILTIESLLDVLASAKFEHEVSAHVGTLMENDRRRRSTKDLENVKVITTRRGSRAAQDRAHRRPSTGNAGILEMQREGGVPENEPFESQPTAAEAAEMRDGLAPLGAAAVQPVQDNQWTWCKCVLSTHVIELCGHWLEMRKVSLQGAAAAAADMANDYSEDRQTSSSGR